MSVEELRGGLEPGVVSFQSLKLLLAFGFIISHPVVKFQLQHDWLLCICGTGPTGRGGAGIADVRAAVRQVIISSSA